MTPIYSIMNRILLLFSSFLIVLAMSSGCQKQVEQQEEDLYVMPERMEEWNDWRFGMFIHWGAWSQTEIGYIWKMVNEEPREIGETRFDLYKTFNPSEFDPKKWARAAKEAGMKYVVFVTKHHDGFNNYDTQLSDLKSTNPEVPYSSDPKADLTKAVVDAFRAEGLAIGLYYSHIDWYHEAARYFSRDYWDFDPSRIDSDPESWKRYVDFERGQIEELLTNYGKIDMLWFDISWPFAEGGEFSHPQVEKDVEDLLRLMKKLQPDLIFNDRGTGKYGGFYTPEQQVPVAGLPGNWESNITITNNRGYWYKGENVSAKSNKELIRMLVDIASKGGNFLMNVGPRPDGELSQTDYDALARVGEWMSVSGVSIYGTRKGQFLQLEWGKSTTNGSTIYLHVYDWPADGQLRVPGLLNEVSRSYLLADSSKTPLSVTADGKDKLITLPSSPSDPVASVVVVEIDGEPEIDNIYRQLANEPVELGTYFANLHSNTASYNFGWATRKGNFLQDIKSTADRISWEVRIKTPGSYRLDLKYATQTDQAGSELFVDVAGQTLQHKVVGTADWTGNILQVQRQEMDEGERHNNLWLFKDFELGEIKFETAGTYTLVINLSPLLPIALCS